MKIYELIREATGKAAVAQAQRDALAAIARKKREDTAAAEEAERERIRQRNLGAIRYDVQHGNELDPAVLKRDKQLRAQGVNPAPMHVQDPHIDNNAGLNNPFDSPELQQYQYVPDDDSGVALRFAVDKHPNTGNPVVFAYWAHNETMSYNDAKGLGTRQSVGEIYSPQTTALISQLIQSEGAVKVIIDQDIAKKFSKEAKKLEKWVQSKEDKKGYEGFLYLEYDTPVATKSVAAPAATTAAQNISIAPELQQQIMVGLRKNKELYSRYEAATPQQRKAALNAAVQYFYKAKDLDGALDEIDVAL